MSRAKHVKSGDARSSLAFSSLGLADLLQLLCVTKSGEQRHRVPQRTRWQREEVRSSLFECLYKT